MVFLMTMFDLTNVELLLVVLLLLQWCQQGMVISYICANIYMAQNCNVNHSGKNNCGMPKYKP